MLTCCACLQIASRRQQESSKAALAAAQGDIDFAADTERVLAEVGLSCLREMDM